jgi:hypothetical protein
MARLSLLEIQKGKELHSVSRGVCVSGTRILNELLECIFLRKNEFPELYKKQVNDGAGLLLIKSNIVAGDKKHSRKSFAFLRKNGLALLDEL